MNIQLPYPPTVNTYWRMFQNRMIISKKGRRYRNAVNDVIMRRKVASGPLTGRLRVVITATMPDKRRRDLDNLNKAVLDGLQNAGVYQDDNQIDELTVIRGEVKRPGWLDIKIIEIQCLDPSPKIGELK